MAAPLGYGLDVTRATLSLMLYLLAGCASHRVRIPGPMRPVDRAEADEEAGNPVIAPGTAAPAGDAAAGASTTGDAATGAAPTGEGSPAVGRGGAPDIARAAARFLGRTSLRVQGERYRADCSGFVAAVYARTGRHLSGSTADLYARAKEAGLLHTRRSPDVGDLAFFDNTYDRNRNGRRDDPLSHVAIVEAIADDGTIILIHYGSRGVARFTMDLRHPKVHVDDDGILRNSYLRSGGGKNRTAGALFRAFGSLWRLGPES
ncbi:MAG: CHAP domain-containing protein [Deltaproteobacteria bacterium]|nr:MAG: CHAP domain-containing protein [Deltaproteobacteria bacterium]